MEKLTPEDVQAVDLVIITTGHSDVDYAMVQKNAQAIFLTLKYHAGKGDCRRKH